MFPIIVIVISILLFTLFLIIITSLGASSQKFKRRMSVLNTIIQLLLLSGVILSAMSYFTSKRDIEREQQGRLTEDNWLAVYKVIEENAPKCPNFARSLVYLWQVPRGTKFDNSNSDDDFVAVQTISFSIFQSLQNIALYFLYYNVNDNLCLWLSSFLIWANSDTLYQFWQTNNVLYDVETREFIDLIFEGARTHPPQNINELEALANAICSSDKMKALFEKHNKAPICSNQPKE